MSVRAKILITITLLAIVVSIGGLRFKKRVDEKVVEFVAWSQTINSFKAQVLMFDNHDKAIGKTWWAFKSQDDWEMIIEDNGIKQAHWIKLGNDVFVKDFKDQKWWQGEAEGVRLNSMVDFRKWIKQNQERLNEIRFELLRIEPCETGQCLMYQVIDPNYQSGREQISQSLWLDTSTRQLIKQIYTGDTGKAEVRYFDFNQTKIYEPQFTKATDTDQNVFLLPNSIQATHSAKMQQQLPLIFPYWKL